MSQIGSVDMEDKMRRLAFLALMASAVAAPVWAQDEPDLAFTHDRHDRQSQTAPRMRDRDRDRDAPPMAGAARPAELSSRSPRAEDRPRARHDSWHPRRPSTEDRQRVVMAPDRDQPRYDRADRDGRDPRPSSDAERRWDDDRGYDRDRKADHWRSDYGRRDSSWNRSWRADRRYDWQRYRDRHRSLYRVPHYRLPYGYRHDYRRVFIGIYLDRYLFGRAYWIADPWAYRLPPAYGAYRWIRYYDDVVLIDLRNGRVMDVIYDFFW